VTLAAGILVTLVGINIGISMLYHGHLTGVYNKWEALISGAIFLGLFYWAGLFNG